MAIELPAGAAQLAALVRERGAPPWRPELAVTLAEAAGVSHAEALFLLAGSAHRQTAPPRWA